MRERLGDPRVVPGFRCSFFPDMPSSQTPGSSDIVSVQNFDADVAFAKVALARRSQNSHDPFRVGAPFRGFTGSHLLRPVGLLAPLYGSDRHAQPTGAFTSRLPAGRSPSPLLDMTTTSTGLLCRRDLHPLEQQLASLHATRRAMLC